MARKLKPSRAKWNGENYYRKESKTWRNKRTGEVSKNLRGSVISHEETGSHPYGMQKRISKRKAVQAQKLFGIKGIRTGGRR